MSSYRTKSTWTDQDQTSSDSASASSCGATSASALGASHSAHQAHRGIVVLFLPRLMSRRTAAAYLEISEAYFTQHVQPKVPPIRIGNKDRWDRVALDRYLDGLSTVEESSESRQARLGRLLNGDGDARPRR